MKILSLLLILSAILLSACDVVYDDSTKPQSGTFTEVRDGNVQIVDTYNGTTTPIGTPTPGPAEESP